MRRTRAFLLLALALAAGCAAPRARAPGAGAAGSAGTGAYEALRGVVRLPADSAAARAAAAMRSPTDSAHGGRVTRAGAAVREAVVYVADLPAGFVPGPRPPGAGAPWSAVPPASSWRAAEESARRRAATRAAAPRTVVIAERGNAFVPRVVVAKVGDTLVVANRDAVYHSPFSVSPALSFDLGRLAPRGARRQVIERPGVVNVFCALHASCVGYVFVAPTPVFARPGSGGAWTLPPLPAGEYTVHAWHPDFGERTRNATLPGGGRRLTIRF